MDASRCATVAMLPVLVEVAPPLDSNCCGALRETAARRNPDGLDENAFPETTGSVAWWKGGCCFFRKHCVCVSCFWRVSATTIGWFEEGNQKAQHVLVAVVFLGALGTNPDDPNGFPEASQVARG